MSYYEGFARTVWTTLVVSGVVFAAPVQQPLTAPQPSRTTVVLLGTGTPAATPERSGPATAIVVNDTAYLGICSTPTE